MESNIYQNTNSIKNKKLSSGCISEFNNNSPFISKNSKKLNSKIFINILLMAFIIIFLMLVISFVLIIEYTLYIILLFVFRFSLLSIFVRILIYINFIIFYLNKNKSYV